MPWAERSEARQHPQRPGASDIVYRHALQQLPRKARQFRMAPTAQAGDIKAVVGQQAASVAGQLAAAGQVAPHGVEAMLHTARQGALALQQTEIISLLRIEAWFRFRYEARQYYGVLGVDVTKSKLLTFVFMGAPVFLLRIHLEPVK